MARGRINVPAALTMTRITALLLLSCALWGCSRRREFAHRPESPEILTARMKAEAESGGLTLEARPGAEGVSQLRLEGLRARTIAWSLSGQRLAVASPLALAIWSAEGALIEERALPPLALDGHEPHAPLLFWLEGDRALFVATMDYRLLRWEEGREGWIEDSEALMGAPGEPRTFPEAISPDGSLALVRGHAAQLWRRTPGGWALVEGLDLSAAAFTPEGVLIAVSERAMVTRGPDGARASTPLVREPKRSALLKPGRPLWLLTARGGQALLLYARKGAWWWRRDRPRAPRRAGCVARDAWCRREGVPKALFEREGALWVLLLRQGRAWVRPLAELKRPPLRVEAPWIADADARPDGRLALATAEGVLIQDGEGWRRLGALADEAPPRRGAISPYRGGSWLMGRLPLRAARPSSPPPLLAPFTDALIRRPQEDNLEVDLFLDGGIRGSRARAAGLTLQAIYRIKDVGGRRASPTLRHQLFGGLGLGVDNAPDGARLRLALPLVYRLGAAARFEGETYVGGYPLDLSLTPSLLGGGEALELTLGARVREFGGLYARAGYDRIEARRYHEIGVRLGAFPSACLLIVGGIGYAILNANSGAR